MPTLKTTSLEPGAAGAFVLSSGQTGNADSTNIADRGVGQIGKPGAIVLTSTVGLTPTAKVDIVGSVDGTNWFNVAYALVATPETATVAQLTVTTAVTTTYLLRPSQPWRWLKLVYSSNTNVTFTATAYV